MFQNILPLDSSPNDGAIEQNTGRIPDSGQTINIVDNMEKVITAKSQNVVVASQTPSDTSKDEPIEGAGLSTSIQAAVNPETNVQSQRNIEEHKGK